MGIKCIFYTIKGYNGFVTKRFWEVYDMITKVEICGVNTGKLPVLKADEKKELFEKLMSGDQEARKKFIYGNLRLVLSVIQRFNNRGENVDDLFQVGCIGLIKAIDNFDLGHNVKFSTYAVPMNVGG
jgi:RNA polymerase sporulation-specific sigma factor